RQEGVHVHLQSGNPGWKPSISTCGTTTVSRRLPFQLPVREVSQEAFPLEFPTGNRHRKPSCSNSRLENAPGRRPSSRPCWHLRHEASVSARWSAPRELESFRHKLSTGRSAGFMFETAASN